MSVKVLAWVFDESEVVHRGDLLVLLVLADHAHEDGSGAYPSVDRIAEKARLSRRGAQLALRRLEKTGAIKPDGYGPRGTVAYRVLMPAKSLRPAKSVHGEVSDTGGRTQTQKGANSPSPEPSLNRQLNRPESGAVENSLTHGTTNAKRVPEKVRPIGFDHYEKAVVR